MHEFQNGSSMNCTIEMTFSFDDQTREIGILQSIHQCASSTLLQQCERAKHAKGHGTNSEQ